ncbi:lipopolysaccharide biosynthesis protein [Intestinibacter bartlettii]|uniref:lipopolysaccharide biosynthesis protein n=1 Tax=Intestinibacter bartlettii TaxID=261299 RepID=UPI00292D06E3|nr:lipopolysaccharide biosynthesis protein [Intestinibacter bartlettii]
MFKKFFFSTIGGTVFSALLGIFMAYKGFGVWAIVAQQLSNTAIDTLILWITVEWRPKFIFSWKRLKSLLSFGWKLLISALLDTTYNNLRNLIIGKLYSPADLAFYNQGDKFPKVIITNINASIDSVLLPTMSREQDNKDKVKSMTRRAIKTSTYLMAPMMMGLAFCSDNIVRLVLTEKWIECVPYLRIFCITYMFWPLHTANLNAINALGRSDWFLRLEIVKKIMGLTVLLLTMWHGVMVMAYSLLLNSVLSQIINSWPNKKLIKYSYIEQLQDILPSILISVFMGICVSFVNIFKLPLLIKLITQIVLGVLVYISMSEILKLESYKYIKNIAKSLIKR